jgi:hypothetical protein
VMGEVAVCVPHGAAFEPVSRSEAMLRTEFWASVWATGRLEQFKLDEFTSLVDDIQLKKDA